MTEWILLVHVAEDDREPLGAELPLAVEGHVGRRQRHPDLPVSGEVDREPLHLRPSADLAEGGGEAHLEDVALAVAPQGAHELHGVAGGVEADGLVAHLRGEGEQSGSALDDMTRPEATAIIELDGAQLLEWVGDGMTVDSDA